MIGIGVCGQLRSLRRGDARDWAERIRRGITMKSLQELYDDVKGDDVLKKSFTEMMVRGDVEDFLREHDCEATSEELREFLEVKAKESDGAELSSDRLAAIAGGTSYYCGEPCSRGETSDCSDTCIRDCC